MDTFNTTKEGLIVIAEDSVIVFYSEYKMKNLNLYRLSKQEVVEFFRELVPEYNSNNDNCKSLKKTRRIEAEKLLETSLNINLAKKLKPYIKNNIPK